MKKFSKVLALGLATTMLGGVFVGCTKQEDPKPPVTDNKTDNKTDDKPADKPAEPVTLRTVSMFGGTDPNAVTYDKLQKEFTDANGHITLQDESATSDETWKASVITDFSAGNEPDVIQYFTDISADPIIEQGKVVSIDEIRKEFPNYASNISNAALTAARNSDGVSYAVPTHGFYEALYVNEDLFNEHGIDLPTDWAKFEAAVEKFSALGITPISVALGDIPHYWIEHLILAEGGVADHGNRDIASVRDSWVNGLNYFNTLGQKGAFPIDTASTKNDIVQTAFINGEAAMFLDGSWAVGALQENPGIIAMAVPGTGNGKNDGRQFVSGFSVGFYITQKAWNDPAKREAAVKYVEYMTSTDAIAQYVTVAGGGAPAADVGELDGLSKLGQSGSAVVGGASAVNMPIDSWLSKPAWDFLRQNVPLIAAGQVDAGEVVDEVIRLNEE